MPERIRVGIAGQFPVDQRRVIGAWNQEIRGQAGEAHCLGLGLHAQLRPHRRDRVQFGFVLAQQHECQLHAFPVADAVAVAVQPAGLLEQLNRQRGIVDILPDVGVVGPAMGHDRRMRDESLAVHDRVDQLLPVEAVHERLADRGLLEERDIRVGFVEVDQRVSGDRGREERQVLMLGRLGHVLGPHPADRVDLAPFVGRHQALVIRVEAECESLEEGRSPVIRRIDLEVDLRRTDAVQLEGTGADGPRVVLRRHHVVHGHLFPEVGGQQADRRVVGKRREGLLEGEAYRKAVGALRRAHFDLTP